METKRIKYLGRYAKHKIPTINNNLLSAIPVNKWYRIDPVTGSFTDAKHKYLYQLNCADKTYNDRPDLRYLYDPAMKSRKFYYSRSDFALQGDTN